jgi:hypothetical protein
VDTNATIVSPMTPAAGTVHVSDRSCWATNGSFVIMSTERSAFQRGYRFQVSDHSNIFTIRNALQCPRTLVSL